MQFQAGKTYKTKSGCIVRVSRLVQVGVDWVLRGAVELAPGIWAMTAWQLNGVNVIEENEPYNLVREDAST